MRLHVGGAAGVFALDVDLDRAEIRRHDGRSDLVTVPADAWVYHFHAWPGQLQAIWEDGMIDFRDVVGRLQATGYRGFYCVEYVHTPRWNNNRLDVLRETIRMRDLLRGLLAE